MGALGRPCRRVRRCTAQLISLACDDGCFDRLRKKMARLYFKSLLNTTDSESNQIVGEPATGGCVRLGNRDLAVAMWARAHSRTTTAPVTI
ncbi:hypothetical protein E2562_001264 [Oryza meyeriana var. granulata]|uniref:Uncharacterized protein n=1 Tax=Oryza meyeriana var. granulata TaxID=110450 RepID=A0A6G1DCL5_9ORYZ|nr:hypothetical protein E2562_001264 [Oryza meyeriana var. granulata]